MSSSVRQSQLTKQHVLSHMLECVDRSPLENDPFPHIEMHRLFPADVYQQLLEMLPTPEQYRSFGGDRHGGNDGYHNRSHFPLCNRRIETLSGAQQCFWTAVRDALGSRQLQRKLYAKFADALAFRFGVSPQEAATMDGFPRPELFRETAGYEITPHPDTRKKVITMQVSLAADDAQSDLGTVFYRRSLRPAAWFKGPFRGFEEVKRMPFTPNTAYAFCVLNTITRKSWHGRDRLRPDCGVRNTILNVIYAHAKDGNQDVLEPGHRVAA